MVLPRVIPDCGGGLLFRFRHQDDAKSGVNWCAPATTRPFGSFATTPTHANSASQERTMRITALLCHLLAAIMLSACSAMSTATPSSELQQQVRSTEAAFARTMEARDHAAFTTFLSDEAVFFSGARVLRGKAEVALAWKRFFDTPTAPFSWQPEQVEVLPTGQLALSSGPVRDPQGRLIATFTSIWRQETPGIWRIVFDKGNDVCDCPKP